MKMIRWITSAILACMLVLCAAPAVGAVSASGTCGEGMSWKLENYTLTVSGSGEIEDGCPWEEYKSKIDHVVLTGGVTKVGANNFNGCDRLETVDFGDALVEIGEKAFYGCEDIEYIHLPKTFRTFGAQSFRGCESLKSVYCDGGMPRFNDSCLWTGNYIAVFYPTNNPWPYEYTSVLVSSYGGNLGIMMGNFDPANLPSSDDKSEETEETQETEAAVAAIAETEAAEETVPPTTQPETVPTTVPEETTVETTEETQPDPVRKVGGDGWKGMVIIAGVLTVLLAGAMIVRGVSRRGGRY